MTNKITAPTISIAGTSQRVGPRPSRRHPDPRASLRSTGPRPRVLTVPIHGEPPKELVKSCRPDFPAHRLGTILPGPALPDSAEPGLRGPRLGPRPSRLPGPV